MSGSGKETGSRELFQKIKQIKKDKVRASAVVSLENLREETKEGKGSKALRTILVVDDEEVIRNVLKRIFERDGYRVLLASDALMLESSLESGEIELILLDVGLPWVDGYELCRLLKENEKFKEVPVIFISGRKDMEDVKLGFQAGAIDYIKKPFSVEEVKETVQTVLKIGKGTSLIR